MGRSRNVARFKLVQTPEILWTYAELVTEGCLGPVAQYTLGYTLGTPQGYTLGLP